ncbi:dienelactone hydrolase family protein [Hamadaea tsunoensis]|uniref:dienelactone hydrolase family protein n=1 Tax=Hamadaea tsunoensis TaxID=53368 RepID=UPI0003FA55B6|nr:dienelactone hydrolase family protein [Hamadaea tsunoensis]
MADVLLFHHSLGLTPGVRAYAEALREAGHTVHLPDLFDGQVFPTIDEGMAYLRGKGFGEMIGKGAAAAEGLPDNLVYAGFSFGVMAAQLLAQTRPGARGALFYYSAAPPSEFGGDWPAGVPVQIHATDQDPFFVGEGDIEFARQIVEQAADGELFLYPGEHHLFADSSIDQYDEKSAALALERSLAFLDRI